MHAQTVDTRPLSPPTTFPGYEATSTVVSKHSFEIVTAEGKKQGWARRIGMLLEVPVSSDDGFPIFFCRSCRSKLLCMKTGCNDCGRQPR